MRRPLFGPCVLATLVVLGPQGTAKDLPLFDPVRVEVEDAPKVTSPGEAIRAEARGRLALMTGKRRLAAAVYRELIAYREADLKQLQARLGQICASEPLEDAWGQLAIARAGLAEAEGDLERLGKVWPTVYHYHHTRFLHVEKLMLLRAIEPEEAHRLMRQIKEEREVARTRASEVQRELRRRKAVLEKEQREARMKALAEEMRQQKGIIYMPIPGFPPPVSEPRIYPQ